MCIIIVKKKDCDRLPSKEELKNSFTYNDDGAGFMYVDKGKVIIDKGYMEWKSFEKHFDKLCKKYHNFKNKSLVIHARIGTSSGNTKENTHPYPITNVEKDLHKTFFKCNLGVAHNGVIHEYTPSGKTPSTNDTQEFIMKYIYPLYSHWKDFYKNEYIMSGLEDITNSKFAFLDTKDNVYVVGDFTEDKGILFSNNSYKTSLIYSNTRQYPSYYGSYYGSYGGWSDWDDYGYEDKKDLTEEYSSKFLKENQDVLEDMIVLESDWYFEHAGNIEKVGDRDLIWDYTTGELFRINDKGGLSLMYATVIVYDSEYEEVI